MSTNKEWVMQRVQELRQEKIEAERVRQLEKQKQLIEWEAQCIFSLDQQNKLHLMQEYIDEMDVYDCITENLTHHTSINVRQFYINHNRQQSFDKVKFKEALKAIDLNSVHISQQMIHLRCLIDFVNEIRASYEYKDKEISRKKKIQDEQNKKSEEERLLREKALLEEIQRKQTIVDNINAANRKDVAGKVNTFQDFKIEDWHEHGIWTEKQNYLVQNGDTWNVRKLSINAIGSQIVYGYENIRITDPPASWASYFEEGKVPFCTKCPICQKQTKFNLITTWYSNCATSNKTNEFKEIYCKDHYFYHTPTKKHYTINPKGQNINIPNRFVSYPNTNQSADYTPTGNWSEWDPTDPDGAKAEAERKRKEAEAIQQQIAALQSKLQAV